MKNSFKLLLIGFLSLFLITTPGVQAQRTGTYYVSPTGNNAWPGTINQPWETLPYAIDQLGAGDTLYIRAGTYNLIDNIYIDPYPAGSANARIRISAYPGETPLINCSTPTDTSCLTVGGDYLTINGLEINGSKRTGLTIWEASHINLTNNIIHDSVRGGIWAGASDWGEVSQILIEGNTLYHNCQMNNPAPNGQGGGWPAAIGSSFVDHMTVQNNLIYENYGEGIAFTLVDNSHAIGNTLYDNYSVNMYMDNATNSVFDSNLVYNTGNTLFYRFDAPATNIQMANEGIYSTTNPIENNLLINNIVIGGRYGFHYGNYENGGGLINVTIANNTFYTADWAVIGIDDDEGHTNSIIANNIVVQNEGEAVTAYTTDAGVRFHHNCWFGGDPGDAAGSGDVNADPLLINPGGTAASDYKLQPLSPAINVGDNSLQTLIAYDYFGQIRPQTGILDMGAVEFPGWQKFLPLLTK